MADETNDNAADGPTIEEVLAENVTLKKQVEDYRIEISNLNAEILTHKGRRQEMANEVVGLKDLLKSAIGHLEEATKRFGATDLGSFIQSVKERL